MKLKDYIKDKFVLICLFLATIFLVDCMLFAFKLSNEGRIGIVILLSIGYFVGFFYEYVRKRKFYKLQ